MLDIKEILNRIENNLTLLEVSDDELLATLKETTREIHHYVITRELEYRRKLRKMTFRIDGRAMIRRKGKSPNKKLLK